MDCLKLLKAKFKETIGFGLITGHKNTQQTEDRTGMDVVCSFAFSIALGVRLWINQIHD